jgi:glycolate oxidase iron-sulfur subunit
VRAFAGLVRDVSEFVEALGPIAPPPLAAPLRLAYHEACHLSHAQGIRTAPRALLERIAGVSLLEIPEPEMCCGSAGTYNILQPEIAERLRDRKVANIARVAPDLVATGNIGCMAQIATGTHIPIVHTVELLDWATGGPVPQALEELEAGLESGAEPERPPLAAE